MDAVTSYSYAKMVRDTASNLWKSATQRNSVNLWQQAKTKSRDTALAKVVMHLHNTSHKTKDSFHPMKAVTGEELPKGFRKSYVGFLLRDHKRKI